LKSQEAANNVPLGFLASLAVYSLQRSAPASERSARGTVSKNRTRVSGDELHLKRRAVFESTKCRKQALAKKILTKREGEIAMQLFEWGARGTDVFKDCAKNLKVQRSYPCCEHSRTNVRVFLENMQTFFGDRSLAGYRRQVVIDYRNYRKGQPSKNEFCSQIKGTTVNRRDVNLRCMCNFAIERKLHLRQPRQRRETFDERRERPAKRMLTLEEEHAFWKTPPPYLRVAIVLLAQRVAVRYPEGFSLRWDQIDLDHA